MQHNPCCPTCGWPIPRHAKPLQRIDDHQAERSNVIPFQPIPAPKEAPYITEHFKLRYVQRVWGVPVDKITREVLTPAVIKAVKAGASACKLANGFVVQFAGPKAVTVYKPSLDAPRIARSAKERKKPPTVQEGLSEFFAEMAEGMVGE